MPGFCLFVFMIGKWICNVGFCTCHICCYADLQPYLECLNLAENVILFCRRAFIDGSDTVKAFESLGYRCMAFFLPVVVVLNLCWNK